MGVGGVQKNRLCLAGEVDVSDKLSLPTQKALIFLTSDGLLRREIAFSRTYKQTRCHRHRHAHASPVGPPAGGQGTPH
jgi:hypothetical protein